MLIIQTVVLDRKTADLLDELARKLGANQSEVIVRAIRFMAHADAILENKKEKKKKTK